MAIKRKQYSTVWPIDQQSGSAPEGWKGWPDNKKFALVLTHDVETSCGHDKSLALMQLEKDLGFTSTFFFVPELYRNSPHVHSELKRNGFEFGIHGLKHDGKLFQSRRTFQERAQKINTYLKEWGVHGFRAPGMHHRLDWLSELNIQYDASTYDIDPFEPQGGGSKTIFPFIFNSSRGNSYVELPYTLPQDFLLFVLMREKHILTWRKKLDWIAAKGGMALLITHPDYINLNACRPGAEQYPADYYKAFLQYIKSTYGGQYWMTTPGELARFWRERYNNTVSFNREDRICMPVFSFYPSDVRVRREAEALVASGLSVDIVCLRGSGEHASETIKGVSVHRLPMKRERKGKLNYIREYFVFIIMAFAKLSLLHIKHRFRIIHVHNMPDVLVLCALVPKLTGSKIMLDLHDPTPEVYETKYFLGPNHYILRILKLIEKWCIGFSDSVITPNISFRNLFVSRSCPEGKINIVMNSPQETIFLTKRSRLAESRSFTIMFHGTIVERHGLDTALEAMAKLRSLIPRMLFNVYGTGDFVDRFLELRELYGLNDLVRYHGPVSLETIAAEIPKINVGLIPNKRSPFTEINMPTRIFEYLCLGKPVVAPRTRGILDYFSDDNIHFFEPGRPESLAGVLLDVYHHPEKAQATTRRGIEVYQAHAWKRERENLILSIRRLLYET